MAMNPMQKKAKTSFLLGVLVTILITGTIIILLFLYANKLNKQISNIQADLRKVYVLNMDVKSGEEFYTVRDPRVEAKKIARLSYNVARAINDKIFYPAESPMCSTYCPADTFCAMWGTPSLEKNGDDIL